VIAKNSLAFRLFAGAAAWAVLLLLLGAIALTTLYRQSIMRTLDDRLMGAVDALVSAIETNEDGSLELVRRPSDSSYGRVFSGRYWQVMTIDEAGDDEVVLVSRSLWDETVFIPADLIASLGEAPGEAHISTSKGPGDEPLRLIAQGVHLQDRAGVVILLAAEDRRPADQEVRNFALVSGLMFLAFAAAIAAGVFFQVRIGLAPVLRMRNNVADVIEGRVERVDGEFPTELQPLADELNAMLDHSRELVERSRTHVGNLAHALKTPLAVLRNESRESGTEFGELVTRQSDVMAKQVDHHLRRARAAAHAKAVGARTELAPMVNDLARTLSKIYRSRGVDIETDIEAGLTFRGERQDLEEMVGNLMDNACKWSSGNVRVTAQHKTKRSLSIAIEDDGPGLDEDECSTALQRGVRLDEQAPGTGLGLAIVTDLAKAYDGEVDLSRSCLGGLCVTLNLPTSSR